MNRSAMSRSIDYFTVLQAEFGQPNVDCSSEVHTRGVDDPFGPRLKHP